MSTGRNRRGEDRWRAEPPSLLEESCPGEGESPGGAKGRGFLQVWHPPSVRPWPVLYNPASFRGPVRHRGRKDKTNLKLAEVQQSRELEGAPTSKLNSRSEEVEGEGGRHGTEELGTGDKKKQSTGTRLSPNTFS